MAEQTPTDRGIPAEESEGEDQDRRKIEYSTPEPVVVYMPAAPEQVGLDWMFKVAPAYDPPGEKPLENWWNHCTKEFPADDPREVFLFPLGKYPPDKYLTFRALTAGIDRAAKRRLQKVIGNVLILSNHHIDPIPALRLIHNAPEGFVYPDPEF